MKAAISLSRRPMRMAASVEVTPKDAGGGVTTVGITVIRPPTAGPAVMPRLQLGRSVTTVSWAPGVTAVPVVPAVPAAPSCPCTDRLATADVATKRVAAASTPNPYTPAPNPYTPAPNSNAAAVGKPELDASHAINRYRSSFGRAVRVVRTDGDESRRRHCPPRCTLPTLRPRLAAPCGETE